MMQVLDQFNRAGESWTPRARGFGVSLPATWAKLQRYDFGSRVWTKPRWTGSLASQPHWHTAQGQPSCSMSDSIFEIFSAKAASAARFA